MTNSETKLLQIPDHPPIAYIDGKPAVGDNDSTGIIWLGGFKSAMDGTKAQALALKAKQTGFGCMRFDYSGHGASGGDFADGTISRWLDEADAVFTRLTTGPQILVGSSMGGWIALLLLRRHMARKDADDSRIAGLVLLAPAIDMTERLIWQKSSSEIRREIETTGVYMRPSAYDDGPYPITRELIEDGRDHLMLGTALAVDCPVRVLHGIDDPDVPWQLSMELADMLEGDDITVTFVKDGDHRLSRPQDIDLLTTTVTGLVEEAGRLHSDAR